jgi:hypothetical protein
MTEFSTRSMLEVVVDDRSLSDARDEIESELGSVRATVGQGSGAGAVPALTDGGDGVRDLLETQTEQLEEIREAVDDLRGGGRGGGGGVAAVGGGLASAAATAGGLGLAGLGPIAAFIGALSANAENGPRTDPGTPGVTQSSPSGRPDTGDTARDTGRMDSNPLIRPPDLSNLSWPDIPIPDWLSTLTNVTLSTPSWLSELTSLSFSTPSWLSSLTNPSISQPTWLSSLTDPQIGPPPWLSELTNPTIQPPPWLSDLESLLGGGGGDNAATGRRPDAPITVDAQLDAQLADARQFITGIERELEGIIEDVLRNEVGI